MERKIPLGLALDPAELERLTSLAHECRTSRSALINDAVIECVDHPEAFGRIISALVAQEGDPAPSARKVKTSALVDINYLGRLDAMARRLVMSRNTLLNMIMGGINLRVI